MSIDKSTRNRLVDEQYALLGQGSVCSFSLTFFEHGISGFFQRRLVDLLTKNLPEAYRYYTGGFLLHGHTYGQGKSIKVLIAGHLHAQITNMVARSTLDDLSATRIVARNCLAYNWPNYWGIRLSRRENRPNETLGAGWLILLNEKLVLDIGIASKLVRESTMPIADKYLLEERAGLLCFKRSPGITITNESDINTVQRTIAA
jgi:hypothetical protein